MPYGVPFHSEFNREVKVFWVAKLKTLLQCVA